MKPSAALTIEERCPNGGRATEMHGGPSTRGAAARGDARSAGRLRMHQHARATSLSAVAPPAEGVKNFVFFDSHRQSSLEGDVEVSQDVSPPRSGPPPELGVLDGEEADFLEGGSDGLLDTGQAIGADEDVLDAAVLEVGEDLEPELGALGLRGAEAEHVAGAVGLDAEHDVERSLL